MTGMLENRRVKRMQKNHKRNQNRNIALNMVSLMDIFTILVFFLLVNATSAEVLPSPKNIVLPEASSEQSPVRNLVIAVDDVIRLQGRPVMEVDKALKNGNKVVPELIVALRNIAEADKQIEDLQSVTIMGDKTIPYALLKKIMLSCAAAEFGNISFAVNQRVAEG